MPSARNSYVKHESHGTWEKCTTWVSATDSTGQQEHCTFLLEVAVTCCKLVDFMDSVHIVDSESDAPIADTVSVSSTDNVPDVQSIMTESLPTDIDESFSLPSDIESCPMPSEVIG
eukprot:3856377-Amphidinium_carterae.1